MPLPALTVIGLMSGTSVDSIDAACIRISVNSGILTEFAVLQTTTSEIEPTLREQLLTTMANPEAVSLKTLCQLNTQMGAAFADAALILIDNLKAQGITVDLIASHGQTLYHWPPANGVLGSTLQIGDPATIAERSGIDVAADFRPGDMAAGGHGAPLVPFADKLLFQHETRPRAVQNIGGIANVTALPALNDSKNTLLAFDTGPGNMIIDALMQMLFDQLYDAGGQIAARGQVHEPLLQAMLAEPYFQQAPPKSTGRERFGKAYTQALLAQWQSQLSAEDMIATATHFTAITIAEAYQRFVLPQMPLQEMIVGGGGVFNTTLMQSLQAQLSPLGIAVKRHEDFGIDSKYKEAIAFALLGYARKMGIPANIPSCTGAKHPVVLGGLWQIS